MNVENLEVGRFSKKRFKKNPNKNQGQKWGNIEKGEDHPQVKNTIGLGCIILKTKRHAE